MRILPTSASPVPAAAPAPENAHGGDVPLADGEAGQDKLRSAVEWGIYRSFPSGNRLVNLKPSLAGDAFGPSGAALEVMAPPEEAEPGKWLETQPAASCDGIYAFGFFQAHGDWQASLGLMARVLNSGGRLFLNAYSREHFELGRTLPGRGGGTLDGQVSLPRNILSPREIGESLERLGLTVERIVPYSSFYGNSLWLETMVIRFRWEKILDWLDSDPLLFAFALGLERAIVARMGTSSAPLFALVAQKKKYPGGYLESALSRDEGWRKTPHPFSREALARWAAIPGAPGEVGFPAHLRDIRNRVFFHHLAVSGGADPDWNGWEGLIPRETAEEFRTWNDQERIDAVCMRVIRGWHGLPGVREAFSHHGLPLGPAFEYDQLGSLLAGVMGCFRREKLS